MSVSSRQARLLYELYGKAEGTAETVLAKKRAVEGTALPDVKAYCPAVVTERLWC